MLGKWPNPDKLSGKIAPAGGLWIRRVELIDAAWTESDAEGITRYLAEQAVLPPPNTAPLNGRNAISAWLSEFFRHFTMTDLRMPERRLTVSGDLGVEVSRYTWKLVPKHTREPIVDDVNWIGIWERGQDGEWREVRGIWNSRLEQ
jgi:ketosteroid isomerase-like protein